MSTPTFCLGPRPKSWQRRSVAPSPSPLTSLISPLCTEQSVVPSSPRLGPSNAPSIPGRSRFVLSVSVSAKSLPSPSLSPSPVLAESTIYASTCRLCTTPGPKLRATWRGGCQAAEWRRARREGTGSHRSSNGGGDERIRACLFFHSPLDLYALPERCLPKCQSVGFLCVLSI